QRRPGPHEHRADAQRGEHQPGGVLRPSERRRRPGLRPVRHRHRRRRGRRRAGHHPAHLPQPGRRQPRRNRPHEGLATLADKAWLIPLLPALSFFVILFFGKKLPKGGSESGILAVGASFVLAVIVAAQWISNETIVDQHLSWWTNGKVHITIGQHVDGLTAMMFVVVTFVSLMVHIYSTGYMHGDVRFTHFFAALSLFTASMLFMVLADNLLQLMIGWELVGLCSFMLIGHWFEEKNNSSAALKAFFTTRTGDVGLMLGIITLFFAAGQTFHIETINR